MIYKEINQALNNETFKNRLIGLDLGTKTIGVSMSDSSRIIASTFETIKRTKTKLDIERILDICDEFKISGIILGYPINMNFTEGPRSQSTMSFAKLLELRTSIPIILWDERLSTSAAEKVLISADLSRKKRKDVIDKLAATYILQGILDRISNIKK
ncbi:MAG: Holliday junction resolvase RuvX [Rhodobiaceae bacterium]|nr:Holliday junction resolvase RuvX [Rhodobiaceae bacterium]RPF96656.1 MAG: Holliday junction resolvase RuvX [Rhizobiales bacterium TMED227]|tara:strand:- start:981 stop:1451 length:471 start_codon:yes stop_codon:yes gene_type:complete